MKPARFDRLDVIIQEKYDFAPALSNASVDEAGEVERAGNRDCSHCQNGLDRRDRFGQSLRLCAVVHYKYVKRRVIGAMGQSKQTSLQQVEPASRWNDD